MKKLFYPRLALAFGLLLGTSAPVAAYMPAPDQSFEDIRHTYVATFNGEGEAAVAAQLRFTNYGSDPITELSFVIPGSSVRVRRAIQQYTENREEPYCLRYQANGPCAETATRTIPEEKYSVVDPSLSQEADGLAVTIPLKHEVQSNERTTLYVSYKAAGYTTAKQLGLFAYRFETPRFPYTVDHSDVTVYADPTLYLQGSSRAAVNYVPSMSEGIASAPFAADGTLKATPAFDSGFSRATEETEATGIHKSSASLDPQETLAVNGSYATTWWRLSWPYLLLALAGVAAFLAIIIMGERRMARQQEPPKHTI